MKKLNSYEEIKNKVKLLKEQCGKIYTNCLILGNTLQSAFDYTEVYCEEFDGGLLVYIDEDDYYKTFYFLRSLEMLKRIDADKRVLIEELDNCKRKEEYIRNLHNLLKLQGFKLGSHVSRIYYELSDNDKDVPELETNSLKLTEEVTKSQFDEIKELWKSSLKAFDIPKEHYNVLSDDSQHLVALIDDNGGVCAVSWWQGQGGSMEVRHTVVRSDHRGEGLGVYITKYLLNKAYNMGFKNVIGYVEEKNEVSIQMHKKVGWKISDKEVWQFATE